MRIWVDLTNSRGEAQVVVLPRTREQRAELAAAGAAAERVRRDPEVFSDLLIGGLIRG